jgi:hypothetical protein
MFASLFSSKSSDKARDITAPEAMAALDGADCQIG